MSAAAKDWHYGDRATRRFVRAVFVALLGFGFVLGLLLGLAVPAFAHEAQPSAARPLGWSYPFDCCSGLDCREVGDAAVHEGPMAYTIVATGEAIPYNDKRIKPSPAGKFHWCSVAGRDDGRTICLFAPPRGF